MWIEYGLYLGPKSPTLFSFLPCIQPYLHTTLLFCFSPACIQSTEGLTFIPSLGQPYSLLALVTCVNCPPPFWTPFSDTVSECWSSECRISKCRICERRIGECRKSANTESANVESLRTSNQLTLKISELVLSCVIISSVLRSSVISSWALFKAESFKVQSY